MADPRDGAAAMVRGMALNRMGRYDLAARTFGAFEKAGGTNQHLDFEYGVALLRTGKHADARARLEKARTSNLGNLPLIQMNLGLASAGLRQWDQAEAAFKAVGEASAHKPDSLLLLSGLAKRRGDEAQAKLLYEELMRLAPDSEAAKTIKTIAAELSKKS
ncbi:MAG: tetratricopeptide repeat protein [Alphaproteobacteria bacterium]